MENIVVSFDNVGRLLLPKKVRQMFSARKFAVQIADDQITLKPIRSWDDLVGIAPNARIETLMKMREEEAKNE